MADYKVVDNEQLATDLTNIANAIRNKAGSSEPMIFPAGFIETINAISQGITPVGSKAITANGEYDVTEFAEANVNVPIPDGYVIPSGSIDIVANGSHNISGKATANVNVPSGLDTSGATAGVYDIYSGKTAGVNGEMITGAYALVRNQKNSGSSGCSSSQLVMDCPFEPTTIMVQYNSGTYAENKIICCWGRSNAIVYHSYGDISVIYNKIELVRNQITSNVSSYWYYSNGKVYINRPNSDYSWHSSNYWVYAFK